MNLVLLALRKSVAASIVLAFLSGFNFAYADDLGEQIMQKNLALKKPNTVESSSLMVIFKGKSKVIKEFNVFMVNHGDENKTRFIFTKPTVMSFISWSQPNKSARQWLNLSGKVFLELPVADMASSFMGSHFYFEDLATIYYDDYDYKFLGEEVINNEKCYTIEARSKKGKSNVYTKKIAFVRKSDYFLLKVDLYEKRGQSKILTMDKIENLDGILTARKVTMSKKGGEDKTIVYLKKIDYNKPISDKLFTP